MNNKTIKKEKKMIAPCSRGKWRHTTLKLSDLLIQGSRVHPENHLVSEDVL
jgi:hypothetical protein